MILKSVFIFVYKREECTHGISYNFTNAILLGLYMTIKTVVTTMFPKKREYKILNIDLFILNTIQKKKNRDITRK